MTMVAVIIFIVAVILPSFGLWWLFRKRGLRLPAAVVGGQLLVLPVMLWIAWHEATPADHDAWGAVAGVAIAGLLISVVWLVIIERWTGKDFT
ncbi:MAG: hypothetical protein JO335_00565 [Sphingomonas sp.]|nr:hypothetical protein [Sphingomonas sp.]